MALTYYFMINGGTGISPDGTLPPGAVVCTKAQYENPSQYIIDYSTTPYTIESVSDATAVEIAQANQVAVVSNSCSSAIIAGYVSTALGGPYLYPAKTTDQLNLLSSLMDAVLSWLMADQWVPNTVMVPDQYVLVGKQLYVVTEGGTTGESVPAWPADVTIAAIDGTVSWMLWSTEYWCADASVTPNVWGWRLHSAMQLFRVGKDAKKAILMLMGENAELAAKILAALNVAAVKEISWP